MLYALLLSMTNDDRFSTEGVATSVYLSIESAVDALLFTSCVVAGEYPDMDLGFYGDYLTASQVPEVAAGLFSDYLAFCTANIYDLLDLDSSDVAHNYILSRNGHGTGLWDMGLGERGERLHAAAEKQGEVYLDALISEDNYSTLVGEILSDYQKYYVAWDCAGETLEDCYDAATPDHEDDGTAFTEYEIVLATDPCWARLGHGHLVATGEVTVYREHFDAEPQFSIDNEMGVL